MFYGLDLEGNLSANCRIEDGEARETEVMPNGAKPRKQ